MKLNFQGWGGLVNIFIVEDDLSLLGLYQKVFENTDHQISDIASNGQEAVEKYIKLSKKPDLIIMDHRMPIKNGLETTKEILHLDNHVKIIFASADKSINEKALSIGASSFLEKPFTISDLINEIERVIQVPRSILHHSNKESI